MASTTDSDSLGAGSVTPERGWRKSRRSMNDGNCAEVASVPGRVLVRDTKDRDGTVLAFGAGAWRAFTAELGGGKVPSATA